MRYSWISIVAMFLVSAVSAIGAQAADIRGKGLTVVDGDEFVFCPGSICVETLAFKIRLCGIDTPSKGRAGHEEAVAALNKFVTGQEIICTPVGGGSVCDGKTSPTSRDRTVAQCFTENKEQDIAGQLVAAKLACDNAKRSGGYYSKDDPALRCKK